MKRELVLDLETYSEVDLTKSGPYPYAEHPSTEVLMCGYSYDGEPAKVLVGHEEIIRILGDDLVDPEVTKIAHNTGFDRVVLSGMLGMPVGHYLDPAQWEDTVPLAAEAGLPLSLADLTKALGVAEKDSAGTRLINLFSKPTRTGERNGPDNKPEEWQSFIDYCRQDVDSLVEARQNLPGWPTEDERKMWIVDQRINDYGMGSDVEFARWAVKQDERNRLESSAKLESLLEIQNAGSVQQIKAGLSRLGLDLPNLRSDALRELLAGDSLTDDQRQALELRLEISLVAAKKYQAVINSACSDSRFRGGFRFYGAHTGRWSGRGVQLQNLPRAQMTVPKAAILDARLGNRAEPQTLKASVRSTFVGPFVVSDYSAIEARVLAWVAGEQWALDAFANDRDIYVETAERMGGLTRQQGKVAVLALGYQGGENSLRHMGAKGSDSELKAMKVQWRRANRRIVKFWEELEAAFWEGGRAGNIRVEKVGRDRHVYLPSGRFLCYRKVKKEAWYFQDEDGDRVRKYGIRFSNSRGRTDTYGGRLAENIVQAVSRDLLGDLLVRLADQGYRTVGHVHDEVIVETSDANSARDMADIELLMSQGPDWAEGLPLAAEAFVCDRYQKG